MAKLEEAFKYAWYASRDPEAKGERIPLPKGRPKSAEPLFRAQMPVKRHAEGTHASNRLRCLRVLLNRLLALRAHFLDGTLRTVEAVNLQRKIRRCPHLPAVQGHSARIQAVKDLIGATEKQQHDDHINAWKNRLRASDNACFRWVRGPPAPLSHMVCLGPAICSDSLDGALLHLRDFWRRVWGRQLPDLDMQLDACRRVLGDPIVASQWTSVSALKSLLKPPRTNAVRARALMDGPGAKSLRSLWLCGLSWLRFSVPAKDGESCPTAGGKFAKCTYPSLRRRTAYMTLRLPRKT